MNMKDQNKKCQCVCHYGLTSRNRPLHCNHCLKKCNCHDDPYAYRHKEGCPNLIEVSSDTTEEGLEKELGKIIAYAMYEGGIFSRTDRDYESCKEDRIKQAIKIVRHHLSLSKKEGYREALEKIESIYLEFGDDPKQALACIAEHVDISLNAKGAHSVDVNGNCNHGCC